MKGVLENEEHRRLVDAEHLSHRNIALNLLGNDFWLGRVL